MKWYLKAVRDNYANFNGRATPQEYWMFYLFNIIFITALFISWIILSNLGVPIIQELALLIIFIYYLGIIIPSLAATVRRLHDVGKSGWMVLISLIPFVGAIVLIVFLCMAGEQSDNDYGPSI